MTAARKPHPHAEVIKAWADGAQVQFQYYATKEWGDDNSPQFHVERQYRIKPEKVYPVTQMRDEDLSNAWSVAPVGCKGLRAIANAALRHAIDAGQVVTKAEHEAALVRLGERLRDVAVTGKTYTTTELTLSRYREVVREEMAARELAIAEAVMNKCLAGDYRPRSDDIDLEEIIARVRP